jgi:hypothetical protein
MSKGETQMKLTEAQLRLLSQAAAGRVNLATGNNGSTRAALRRLMNAGLMNGHAITDAGREALVRKTKP